MKHETTVACENDIEIKECSCDQNPPPLKMFVSGVGGTGKSFLINCIKHEIILLCMNRLFPNDDEPKHEFVVVLAPTGVAAFNINGETIHGFYKLPVQKGKKASPQYREMMKDDVKLLRLALKYTKLIIIDEISMVGNVTFAMIHRRMDDTFPRSDDGVTFGGHNMLLFGDLLQVSLWLRRKNRYYI